MIKIVRVHFLSAILYIDSNCWKIIQCVEDLYIFYIYPLLTFEFILKAKLTYDDFKGRRYFLFERSTQSSVCHVHIYICKIKPG